MFLLLNLCESILLLGFHLVVTVIQKLFLMIKKLAESGFSFVNCI